MGVSPPPLGSPQCDYPREGNNSTITLRRGGPGGQALSPPFKACVLFILCWNKRNSTEPILTFWHSQIRFFLKRGLVHFIYVNAGIRVACVPSFKNLLL